MNETARLTAAVRPPRDGSAAGVRRLAAFARGVGLAAALAAAHLAAAPAASMPEQEAVDTAAALVVATEFLDAINVVEAAIDAVERRSSRYNIELAQPLLVLGDALAGVGDTDGAFGAYDRALHITRVNLGLHHPQQAHAVYREAALLAKEGDYAKANVRHEYAYGVLLRSHGGRSPELLPGLFVLADWYMSNYNIFSARQLYHHAADVAEEHLGGDHPSRIRALRSVAATYRSERFPPTYRRRPEASGRVGSYTGFQYRQSGPSINSFARGERALIEVVKQLQGQESSERRDLEIAKAMLDLGDWFLMFDKHHRATTLYQRVWEILEPRPALLARTFSAPTPLYLPLPRDPSKPEGADGEDTLEGVVELSIAVNTRGMVSRIDTVRSEPHGLMDFKMRRAVKRARYRPAFDGEAPRTSDDVRVTHTFVYYPSAAAAAAADNADRGGAVDAPSREGADSPGAADRS